MSGGCVVTAALGVPAGAPAAGGQVCLASATDAAVPPPAGDVLTLDGVALGGAAVAWGRLLCTPAGAVGPGAHVVQRTSGGGA